MAECAGGGKTDFCPGSLARSFFYSLPFIGTEKGGASEETCRAVSAGTKKTTMKCGKGGLKRGKFKHNLILMEVRLASVIQKLKTLLTLLVEETNVSLER